MIKASLTSLCAVVLFLHVPPAPAQVPATESAINEAIRRQADTIVLRQRLIEGQRAVAENDLPLAAKLYEDALSLHRRIGSGVDAEGAKAVEGMTSVRIELAKQAQSRHDYREADVQLSRVLSVKPDDEAAAALKSKNDKLLMEQAGRIPSQEAVDQVPEIVKEKVNAGTLTQDGKLFYELGKLDEAESRLKEALAIDPQNRGARYYLDLVRETRSQDANYGRESYSRDAQVVVEKAWNLPIPAWEEGTSRANLPIPNPFARTNLNYTGTGRQIIMNKLDRIHLDSVIYDGLPLGEVIRVLNDEAKKRDPEKRGINFLLNPNQQASSAVFSPVATQFDPVTGLPITAPPTSLDEETDLSGVLIKINPPLTNLRLADVLDAIVTVSELPIKYSVEEYAVVFSFRAPEPQPLHTREFKVDPNTFWSGLESVGSLPFGDIQTSSGSGGGGGGGSRGGGGQSGQGGGGLVSVPRVSVAGEATTGGGGGGGAGGGAQQQLGGVGLRFITRTNTMEDVQAAVRQFFITMGVDLTPPKTIFFNDRSGYLFARATTEELDIIQSAIQVLNRPPPQVNIKAKFADIGQKDQKAVGFDWFLGNFLIGNGNIVGSGGTQPSLQGQPSPANPLGFFPGTSAGLVTAPSSTDQQITSGLGYLDDATAPALASITGILTDPQFKVVIRALEQRQGVDLLSAPEVTTLSGRQAQVQIVDIQTIVTSPDINQQGGGGGGGGNNFNNQGGGNGAVGTTLNYTTQPLPFGPVLDVIPYVSSDGYTVQMVIIPTVTEFLGYDDPGQFIPQAQSVSSGGVGGGVGTPLVGQLPLPHFRLRQVTTTVTVWDGQTVVLGGLISEGVQKQKDKVPVLGDLPLFGRFFRSESSITEKRNLVIFVTPTIIDPAGNRFHVEEEMPFNEPPLPDVIQDSEVSMAK